MSDWQAGDIEVNGVRLHYTRTGGSKPPMVLAHGVTDDGLCWTPIAEVLASEYDVIMVDARGHGRSSAPEGGYDAGTMGDDLAGLIRGLGLESPIVLGHSMGAITALALAGNHPDLPRAILLEDPPPWWMTRRGHIDSRMPEIVASITQMVEDAKRLSRDEVIANQRAASPDWPEAELGPWADSKIRFDRRGLALLGSSGATAVDWATILPRITCPVLLITADVEQGAIVSPESAARLRELLPQIVGVHIAGAGHNIRRQQPAAYLSAVRGFLAKLPA